MIGLVDSGPRSARVWAVNDSVLLRLRLEIPDSFCSESGRAESVFRCNGARASDKLVAQLGYD